MSDKLREICDTKRAHVAKQKAKRSPADLQDLVAEAAPPRGFAAALRAAHSTEGYGLICEIKKASPSKGLIREDFDPPALARAYKGGGASCLSVLTDRPYFQGEDRYLHAARDACALPALRKDFMVDPYQILESRALGADAILLIMAALDDGLARDMEAQAHDLGMDVLIEVHNAPELDRALHLTSPLIGINNRNLKTMAVSVETFVDLAPRVPKDRFLVAESGLASRADLATCLSAGAAGFLIGETFMRQQDVTAAVQTFRGVKAQAA